ncbi:MAG: glycosyltransferase family A protein [Flavobacteriales bacterium]
MVNGIWGVNQFKVQVYILSRDRPHLFEETLRSVIEASNSEVDVVVSDNSVGDSIEEIVKASYPAIRYTRRTPPLDAFSHFNAILQEASTEYLVMFHDDDRMMPNYVPIMLGFMEANPGVVAAACNARILFRDEESERTFMPKVDGFRLIEGIEDFFECYLRIGIGGGSIAPFPGYMYRRSMLQGIVLNSKEAGKYSDVSFLSKLLVKGPLLWVYKPLMWYRFHDQNDSGTVSIAGTLGLLRYILETSQISRQSLSVHDYRFKMWADWWLGRFKKQGFGVFGQRVERIVFRFLAGSVVRLAFTRFTFWKLLFRKLFA